MDNKEREFYKDIIKSDILIAKTSIKHFISEERINLTTIELDDEPLIFMKDVRLPNSLIESKKALDNLEEVLYNIDEALSFLKRIGDE